MTTYKNAPSNWTESERPKDQSCPCGMMLGWYYVQPVFELSGKLLCGDEWYLDDCSACAKKRQAQEAERISREFYRGRISRLGLNKLHFKQLGMKSPNPVTLDTMAHGAILYGPPGTGKTFMAVHTLMRFMDKNTVASGRFIVVAELLADLRLASSQGHDIEMIDKIGAHDMLVLDDLGAHRLTDYAAENLYLIIDRWHREMKPGLIVTTNFSLSELSLQVGDRLVSRLMEICQPFHLDGRDRRISP